MAKLNEFKNPLTADKVNVLSPADWLASIGYVAFFGVCLAVGAKLLTKADNVIPGKIAPNAYTKAVEEKATSGVVVF